MKAVNLLPDKDRRHEPSGAQSGSAYAVIGVLALVLLAAVVYSITANQVTSRKADAQRVGREADDAEARAARLGAFGAFAAMKQERTASITGLAAGRFDWERTMREIALVLPTGVFIRGIDASTAGKEDGAAAASGAAGAGAGEAGAGGGSASPSGAGAASPADAAPHPGMIVTGCAPGQSDVATTIVRLRQLHRAEDVSLTESTRQADGEGECGVTAAKFAFTTNVAFKAAPTTAPGPKPGSDPNDLPHVPGSLGGGS